MESIPVGVDRLRSTPASTPWPQLWPRSSLRFNLCFVPPFGVSLRDAARRRWPGFVCFQVCCGPWLVSSLHEAQNSCQIFSDSLFSSIHLSLQSTLLSLSVSGFHVLVFLKFDIVVWVCASPPLQIVFVFFLCGKHGKHKALANYLCFILSDFVTFYFVSFWVSFCIFSFRYFLFYLSRLPFFQKCLVHLFLYIVCFSFCPKLFWVVSFTIFGSDFVSLLVQRCSIHVLEAQNFRQVLIGCLFCSLALVFVKVFCCDLLRFAAGNFASVLQQKILIFFVCKKHKILSKLIHKLFVLSLLDWQNFNNLLWNPAMLGCKFSPLFSFQICLFTPLCEAPRL